ncbi:MAG: hypothetical protein U9N61_02060 [Euryarchaeota archaeon]|nr:hypothetical protein [Euryarchaeota archaeon]
MEDIDIDQIKASLLEEQRLETKLKKRPEASDELLPLLHNLYIARMNLERANWGCSVDRDRFSLLKSSLLEEAHLEELLKQEPGNNGTHEGYNLEDVATPTPLKQESTSMDSDLQKLLNIAKNKSTIYISELEANLDPTVACPLLPTGETPRTIATKVKQKTDNYLKDRTIPNVIAPKAAEVTEPKNATKQELLKEKEKRRQLVRYILSSTK